MKQEVSKLQYMLHNMVLYMKKLFVIGLALIAALSCKKENDQNDFGKWENISAQILEEKDCSSIASINGVLFTLEIDFLGNHNLYKSTDDGQSWNLISPTPAEVDDIVVWDDHIVIGTNRGIFKSKDYGKSWTSINSGLPLFAGNHVMSCDKLIVESKLYCFYWLNTSIYSFSDDNWKLVLKDPEVAKPILIEAFTSLDNQIYIGVMDGIFKSTDGGVNWNEINIRINLPSVLTHIGQSIIVGSNSGLYFSSDGEIFNKSLIDNQSDLNPRIYEFVITSNTIYAAATNGVLVSVDKGKTWSSFIEGFPNYIAVKDIVSVNGTLFVATNNGIWKRKL